MLYLWYLQNNQWRIYNTYNIINVVFPCTFASVWDDVDLKQNKIDNDHTSVKEIWILINKTLKLNLYQSMSSPKRVSDDKYDKKKRCLWLK